MRKGLSSGKGERQSLQVTVYAPIPLYATAVVNLINGVYTNTRVLPSLEDLPAKASDDRAPLQEVLLVVGVPRSVPDASVPGYLQAIMRQAQRRPVVLLNSDKSPHLMVEALKQGFRGYLFSPQIDPDVLVSTIWLVARGMVVFNVGVVDAQTLGRELQRRLPVAAKGDTLSALSSREQEVYSLLRSRLTNREIAAQLGVGIRTVQAHVGRIAQKLGVRSRTDVVIHAALEKDGQPEPATGV